MKKVTAGRAIYIILDDVFVHVTVINLTTMTKFCIKLRITLFGRVLK